jgi:hypothetical protein
MLMTKPVTDTPTAEQQRLLVDRIVASVVFRKSHKLSAFLKFICEQQQLGRADSINEQRIGTEVFGRTEGYHMGEDSIVRSQARFLRQRLEEYFATEGRDEAVRLTIPKGSYVPEFHFRDGAPEPEPVKMEQAVPVAVIPRIETAAKGAEEPSARRGRWRFFALAAVGTVCVAGFLAWHFHPAVPSAAKPSAESRFWSSVFDPQRPQIVVPADSSLILTEELSGKRVDPSDYMSRKYLNAPAPPGMAGPWNAVINSQYTSIADLNLVARLERLPEAGAGKAGIRFARDLNLKELKESNAILIGSARANPWGTLFNSSGHFQVDYDWQSHTNYVSNRTPGPGEQARYDEVGDVEQHMAYGVVSYLPSLDGEGAALLVGGTSKAGTEAAADFLFSSGFGGFLRSIESGGDIPHFEILLSTRNINGNSYYGKIVCFHLLPDGVASH